MHLKSRIRRFPRTAPSCARYLATIFLDYAYQSRDVPKRKHGIPRMKVVGPLYSRGLSWARPRPLAARRGAVAETQPRVRGTCVCYIIDARRAEPRCVSHPPINTLDHHP